MPITFRALSAASVAERCWAKPRGIALEKLSTDSHEAGEVALQKIRPLLASSAKAFGLTIPQSLLVRADEVIQ
jgi:hypothetical protein